MKISDKTWIGFMMLILFIGFNVLIALTDGGPEFYRVMWLCVKEIFIQWIPFI